MPGMFAPPQKPMPDTVQQSVERGKAISKGVRMAGEALGTAFGGGANIPGIILSNKSTYFSIHFKLT